MRDVGAHIDLDLPTVVVCGNQNVGKSSLLEGLCGLNLPRAEGTCTRCVVEVRLYGPENAVGLSSVSTAGAAGATTTPVIEVVGANADRAGNDDNDDDEDELLDSWRCRIKLRFEYDAQGNLLSRPKEVPFGSEIGRAEDVELWVRRAQKALLNPSTESNRFLAYTFDDSSVTARDKEAASNELKFTRNIVCLEVFGAGINLTLIDLPGIIHSVDRKDQTSFIQLVKDLVRDYIFKERTIVVATVTCKDDIENQAVIQLAQEVDPEGRRTLGVLTKPDTIEPGSHERWLNILLGSHYKLKLGYWIVKNPSKTDREKNITNEKAREMEMAYFSEEMPWAALRHQLDRFGIDSLRSELSRQLSMLTDSSLPSIRTKVEESLQAVSAELATIPPPLNDNARIELLQLIRHFVTIVESNLSAHQEHRQFYQKVRQHFEVFRMNVAKTRPQFVVEKKTVSAGGASLSIPGGGLASSISSSISSVLIGGWVSGDDSRKRDSGRSSTSNGPLSSLANTANTTSLSTSSNSTNGPLIDTYLDTTKPISTSDLLRIIESQKGRELQGMLPYGAFSFLISSFQRDWAKHAEACLVGISQELHVLLNKLTDEVFGRFSNLHSQVRLIVQLYQSELYRTTLDIIGTLITMEKRYPFTLGSEEFSRLKSNALVDFKAQLDQATRPSTSTPSARPESINKALAALTEAGYTGLTPRDLSKLRDPSLDLPEEDELLQIMAASEAYFRISSKRFIDTVPMHADFHFLSKFGGTLERTLVGKLGVLEKGVEALEGLMMEDRFVVERRKGLVEKKERLEVVWKGLHEFGM
ncbi:hypothetical protein HK102_012735, partial [Quaeritorhiza haematococci]